MAEIRPPSTLRPPAGRGLPFRRTDSPRDAPSTNRVRGLATPEGEKGTGTDAPSVAQAAAYRAPKAANLRRKFTPERKKRGAGYGDRTRLTGLGSQDITTMLSPHTRDLINPRRRAQAR